MPNNFRRAEKAGSWYPASRDELTDLIDTFLKYSSSQVDLSLIEKLPCQAAITPHAGLAFSGECATRAYYAMKQKHPNPKTIIIFGAVHSHCTSSAGIWSSGEWDTPLGSIDIDSELAERVINNSCAQEDFTSHLTDNAIELQTPLIKYFFPESMILPISTPPTTDSASIGSIIAEITSDNPENYLAVGSSDLTHYGAAYGFSPAGNNLEGIEWARENDKRLITLIEELQTSMIIPEVLSRHNACGSGAITALTSFASSRNILKGYTLEHILSHDIMPSNPPELSVGYASIIF